MVRRRLGDEIVVVRLFVGGLFIQQVNFSRRMHYSHSNVRRYESTWLPIVELALGYVLNTFIAFPKMAGVLEMDLLNFGSYKPVLISPLIC